MKRGILFLISGPSGVGKHTLLVNLLKMPELNLHYSISMTTRKKRENEIDNKDYYFVTKAYFQEQIAQQKMLEYAQFFDNFYGTPKSKVEEMLNLGKNVILEIEVIGAKQVMQLMPDCVSIFILPPSLEELYKRLVERKTESLAMIEKRIAKARDEIELKTMYQYNVINDDLANAEKEIIAIIKKEILAK
ncbi:Guanylate kinase [[Mycoplasma] cavipharyngis]|uniref:guanylate kinase n=1 Tax=[Mycoplasma] cavipharyngis TaxID=92757 RepID=UPI003704D2A7